MKKNWIYLKRGLLTPEHVHKMGVRLWLYVYICDGADWPTGVYEGWKDRFAADDLGLPEPTVRDQRSRLVADGYLSCKQTQHGLRVTIHKWVNPREYSGRVYNTPDVADDESSAGAESSAAEEGEGVTHGDTHGVTHGDTPPQAPSLNPKTIIHSPLNDQTPWVQALASIRLDRFRNRTPGDNFSRYFQPTVSLGLADGVFRVACQDEDQRAWLQSNGRRLAENALVGVLGKQVRVEFVVEASRDA